MVRAGWPLQKVSKFFPASGAIFITSLGEGLGRVLNFLYKPALKGCVGNTIRVDFPSSVCRLLDGMLAGFPTGFC